MVGRPRKAGKREKSGKLQRTYVNPKQQVAMQPHRFDVPARYREREEAESAFGRLMLREEITPAQYEAGKLYASLAAQHRRVYDVPPIHPTGIDLNRVSGGGHDGDIPRHVAEAVKRRANEAFEAIGSAKGQRVIKDCVIMEMQVPDPLTLQILVCGLSKLVDHFAIDKDLKITDRPK